MLIAMPQKLWRINTCLKVYINNVQVPVSTCEKLLGAHIQANLDWSLHVNNVCKVVKCNLNLLRRIKCYLSVHARKMFCSSYMFSYMDYLINVWGNTTQENLNKLQRHLKHAARLVLDDWHSASSELLKKLEWLPIQSRISHSKMVLVYKILNNMCPGYLNDLLQYQNNSVYNMRSTVQGKLAIPKVRCEMFKKSLKYSGPHIWNQLPSKLHHIKSLSEFKKSCKQHFMSTAFCQ